MQNEKDTFTLEQRDAIDAQGKTIVSASAGSGKTTVMIEKIIRYIQGGGSVSSILAVTFTKKAASQMKEKLRKALIKQINENVAKGERARLKTELDAVQSADISTIHSFCARLIRTHFYALQVDSAFRIIGSDDAEAIALKNEAVERLLDDGYENKVDFFSTLVSCYWRKKSDLSLRKYILESYDDLMCRDDYEEYLQRSTCYNEDTFKEICQDLLVLLKTKTEYYRDLIETEWAYFQDKPQCATQTEIAQALMDCFDEILTKKTYFEACAVVRPTLKQNRSNKKMTEEDNKRKEILGGLKDRAIKGIFDEIIGITKDEETEKKNFLRSSQTAKALSVALQYFHKIYASLKAERNVLDYNDLEHMALLLLSKEEIVNALKEKYHYVFVDEYQDVNPVQEAILSKISGKNVFLVGDVKQSIYGFRGSKSKFFVQKSEEFKMSGENDLKMRKNFRSTDAVLDAVNAQFALAMTPQVCSVDYAREGIMKRGGLYPENSGKVCVHFLPDKNEETVVPRVYSVKNDIIQEEMPLANSARLIKDIIDKELLRTYEEPGKEPRPMRYSDIAVLTRKKNKKDLTDTIAVLAAEGIPITSASAVNICQYSEIKTLIDIISLIDNAQQDVPLCSALLSSMGNLTADELADIRLAYPTTKEHNVSFRTACQYYAEEKNDKTAVKLRNFFAYFNHIRDMSSMLSAGELLSKIITDTHMEASLLSKDNRESCLRRINRFIEETNVDKPLSVHEFVERLRALDFEITYAENGGENAVKVLTMHSSKGLEYPVVILNDLSAKFRGADNDEVLLEEKFGIAPRAFDEEKMTKNNTLLRLLCRIKQLENSVADELNLYYVAMTRAQDSLHLIFSEPTLFTDVKYAKSFADFTNFSVWQNYIVEDELLDLPKQDIGEYVFNPDNEEIRKIEQAFTWQYAHMGYENFPVKSSASQILSVRDKKPYIYQETVNEKTEELQAEQTSVEQGLAYHAFLENMHFARLFNEDGIRITSDDLYGLISEICEEYRGLGYDWVELLDKEKLLRILQIPIFAQLQDKTLYKEQQFLVSLPINETYAKYAEAVLDDNGEEMIFQGAIDLLAIGEDEAWIIDYKDSVRSEEDIKRHYTPQLELYRLTVEKITKFPKENIRCFIVNLHHGYQVEL